MIIAEFVLDEQFRHIPIAGLNVHYMRELGFGVLRFKDIRANTGAPRDTLAAWLRQLEEVGPDQLTPLLRAPAAR
jgi:hypothetical protein